MGRAEGVSFRVMHSAAAAQDPAAAALLALALRPPVVPMVALLVLMTTSLAVAYGPHLALLVDLVPSRQRARVGSVLNVGNMPGQMLMLWLASQLWAQREALVFALAAGGLVLGDRSGIHPVDE